MSMNESAENEFDTCFWLSPTFEERCLPTITEVSDYDGGPSANIACTQLLESDERKKRRILNEWVEVLPSLPIHFLRFSCHVPEKLLNAACKNVRLKGLYIKWTGAKSIASIRELNNLQQLYLGSAAGVRDPTPISSLDRLTILVLENLKGVTNYSFLKYLNKLKSLSIEGGMYSRPVIEDLNFVTELKQLQSFSLIAMKCLKPSLRPFESLKTLNKLFLCCSFSRKEEEWLEGQLPNLRYGFEYYRKLRQKNFDKINETFGL